MFTDVDINTGASPRRRALFILATIAGDVPEAAMPDLVRALLGVGAWPNAVDSDGRTPLELALGTGRTALVAALLRVPTVRVTGVALAAAARAGNRDLFGRLVARAVAADGTPSGGGVWDAALMHALNELRRYRPPDWMNYSDPTDKKPVPLLQPLARLAVRFGAKMAPYPPKGGDCDQWFSSLGVAPTLTKATAMTPWAAVSGGSSPLAGDGGVAVNAAGWSPEGLTAPLAASLERDGHPRWRQLLAAGAAVNWVDSAGCSPLAAAVSGRHSEDPELLVVLLRDAVPHPSGRGAAVNTGDEKGVPPLLIAMQAGRWTAAGAVLDAGAHVFCSTSTIYEPYDHRSTTPPRTPAGEAAQAGQRVVLNDIARRWEKRRWTRRNAWRRGRNLRTVGRCSAGRGLRLGWRLGAPPLLAEQSMEWLATAAATSVAALVSARRWRPAYGSGLGLPCTTTLSATPWTMVIGLPPERPQTVTWSL